MIPRKPLPPFSVGDKVQLHPATDTWMRGDRYGTVAKVTRSRVSVTLDVSGQTRKFNPSLILQAPF